jgi:hypothetical protein
MTTLNEIPNSYDEAVRSLAEWHGGEDVTIYIPS